MSSTITIQLKQKKTLSFQRKKILPYLLVSPYIIFVIVFVLFPVLFCFFLTFNKRNIILIFLINHVYYVDPYKHGVVVSACGMHILFGNKPVINYRNIVDLLVLSLFLRLFGRKIGEFAPALE